MRECGFYVHIFETVASAAPSGRGLIGSRSQGIAALSPGLDSAGLSARVKRPEFPVRPFLRSCFPH